MDFTDEQIQIALKRYQKNREYQRNYYRNKYQNDEYGNACVATVSMQCVFLLLCKSETECANLLAASAATRGINSSNC